MTRLDTDEIATLVRIYGTPAEQAQLLRQTRIIRGQLCPECGAEEAESNGCAGSDEEFRCCRLTAVCITLMVSLGWAALGAALLIW